MIIPFHFIVSDIALCALGACLILLSNAFAQFVPLHRIRCTHALNLLRLNHYLLDLEMCAFQFFLPLLEISIKLIFLSNERINWYIQNDSVLSVEFCCWCIDCCGSTSTESDRFVSGISECYSWFLVFLSHCVLFFSLSVCFFLPLFLDAQFCCSKFLLSFSHSSSSSSSSSSSLSFFCSFIRWYFFCYLHFCLLPVFFCVYSSRPTTKQWHWLSMRV